MAKEVMVVTPEDIKSHIALSAAASDTLKWMIAHAGVEMDEEAQAEFIQQRALRVNEIRECWELKAWCEKAAASIKEATKHTMNVGTEDDLPAFAKWNKQSYSYDWNEGAARVVAQHLIESNLVTAEQLFDQVSVTAMCKAAGITTEKLLDMFDGAVIAKPKERTLSIK